MCFIIQIEVISDRIGMVYSGMGPDFRYCILHVMCDRICKSGPSHAINIFSRGQNAHTVTHSQRNEKREREAFHR